MVKRDEAKPSTERWSAEEARAVLARWRASGLTRTAFAEGQGVNYERLRRWEKRLAGEKESALRLVPVVARETTRSSEGATVKLQLPGGMMLEFDTARVDPRWVAALVFDVLRTLRRGQKGRSTSLAALSGQVMRGEELLGEVT